MTPQSTGWNSEGLGYGSDFSLAYLTVGDYNVFSIDWEKLASWTNYPAAAVRTRPVGTHAAQLVVILVQVLAGQGAGGVGKLIELALWGKLDQMGSVFLYLSIWDHFNSWGT